MYRNTYIGISWKPETAYLDNFIFENGLIVIVYQNVCCLQILHFPCKIGIQKPFFHITKLKEVSTLVSILVYFNFYENDPSSVWLSSEAPLLPQTLLVLNYESLKLHGVHGRNTSRWNMHITFIVDCIKLGNLKE